MNSIILILVMSVTIEGLVEYAKTIIASERKAAITQLSALALSVLLCLSTDADLYAFLGVPFVYPVIGTILTGIFVSRGTNYISDLIGKLQKIGGAK